MSGGGILHHINNVTPHSRWSGSPHRGGVLYIPMVKLSYEKKNSNASTNGALQLLLFVRRVTCTVGSLELHKILQ